MNEPQLTTLTGVDTRKIDFFPVSLTCEYYLYINSALTFHSIFIPVSKTAFSVR